jgi:hypothetical protein
MRDALTIVVCLAFVVLALWHFYMAMTPGRPISAAVPSANGKALFLPSVGATIAVGIVLFLFAALVAATGVLVPSVVPHIALVDMSYVLALGLLARAVGEFKYVGFFKRIRGGRFARMDTLLYSPVCLLLAIGVALVATQNSA